MPRFRSDLSGLVTYVPGRPIEEVGREIGMDPAAIAKLASNESPDGPFPGVVEAIHSAASSANRYPDNDAFQLTKTMAEIMAVSEDELWFGAGSTGLLTAIASRVGGPGTSAVYAWPSFVMYRIITRWAGSEPVEVPLDDQYRHDLEALGAAISSETSVVYVCNPNNPTGTIVPSDEIEAMITAAPDDVLFVVDEAYHDYVDHESYRSLQPLARSRQNVVVLRTFSKIYALAGLRVGYAIGRSETLSELRKTQPPFSVSTLAQSAALASLNQPDELSRRVAENASGRRHLLGVLGERGLKHADSQANFVYFHLDGTPSANTAFFTERGVIVRPMSRGWIRLTIGSEEENRRFVGVLDELLNSGNL